MHDCNETVLKARSKNFRGSFLSENSQDGANKGLCKGKNTERIEN